MQSLGHEYCFTNHTSSSSFRACENDLATLSQSRYAVKILVVGGAGYIGSVVCEQLVKDGFDVVILDNLLKGHKEAVTPGCVFVEGDMGDSAANDRAFAHRPDAVMHFAALSLVGDSVKNPALYFANNIRNGLVLLERCILEGVKKFVFSSTAAVYGNPDRLPLDENSDLRPENPYGESKLAFEKFLKWYSTAYGMHYAVLRYFNAAGATENLGEDHNPESHLIPIALEAARDANKKVTIFGDDYATADGTCIRDYIHVSDLSNAHILALKATAERREQIYNLGSEQGFSVKEVIETAKAVTGKSIQIEIGARRDGDPPSLVASSEKIRRELSWAPTKTDLRTIISDAWRFKLKYPNGYASTSTTSFEQLGDSL